MKVYLYGTLGHLGGAATKIRHLLDLLHKEVDFTVILTHPSWRRNKQVMGFLKELNIPHCMVKDSPRRVSSVDLVFLWSLNVWGWVQGRLGKEGGLECLAIVDEEKDLQRGLIFALFQSRFWVEVF